MTTEALDELARSRSAASSELHRRSLLRLKLPCSTTSGSICTTTTTPRPAAAATWCACCRRPIPGVQRVIAASLSFAPTPERALGLHRFLRQPRHHRSPFATRMTTLDIRLQARVAGRATRARRSTSRRRSRGCSDEIAARLVAGAGFAASFPRPPAAHAGSTPRSPPMRATACRARLGRSRDRATTSAPAIHRDFTYDGEATTVDTDAARGLRAEARRLPGFRPCDDRRPARRSASRPAMSAASCAPSRRRASRGSKAPTPCMPGCGSGAAATPAGWSSTRPTPCCAGTDHITVGHGRDYSDMSPDRRRAEDHRRPGRRAGRST